MSFRAWHLYIAPADRLYSGSLLRGDHSTKLHQQDVIVKLNCFQNPCYVVSHGAICAKARVCMPTEDSIVERSSVLAKLSNLEAQQNCLEEFRSLTSCRRQGCR